MSFLSLGECCPYLGPWPHNWTRFGHTFSFCNYHVTIYRYHITIFILEKNSLESQYILLKKIIFWRDNTRSYFVGITQVYILEGKHEKCDFRRALYGWVHPSWECAKIFIIIITIIIVIIIKWWTSWVNSHHVQVWAMAGEWSPHLVDYRLSPKKIFLKNLSQKISQKNISQKPQILTYHYKQGLTQMLKPKKSQKYLSQINKIINT